jgi:hypothetical protein
MPRMVMFREKSYESKIDESELYMIAINTTEPMRGCKVNRCNKSSMQLQGANHLEETNKMSDSDKVMKDTFGVILDIYILAPS